MKMHVLAMAVVTALVSGAAVAASEGGDTWSDVAPVQQAAYSALQPATQVGPSAALDAASGRSEGGDTWSDVQEDRHEAAVRQAGAGDRADRADATAAAHSGESEGGDTWSAVESQSTGQSTGTAIASKPAPCATC
jgi:hypothetical protein